jgi:hypothetical protein
MRTILLSALLLIATLGLSAQHIIYVTPSGDGTGNEGDPTNLQAALDMARTNGMDDEIRLYPGPFPYYVNTPYEYNLLGSDGMDVKLTGHWTAGPPPEPDPWGDLVALSGTKTNRVLHIRGLDAGVDMEFSIEHLFIFDGRTDAENGAGILVEGGQNDLDDSNIRLKLLNVSFYGNETTNDGSGAAIFTDGPFEITDCLFQENISSGSGGALMATYRENNEEIPRFITGCTFTSNGNYGNQGSCIWHNTGLIIQGSKFQGAYVGSTGSCIWGNSGSTTYIRQSVFEDIRIEYWGSAVHVWDGDLMISNSLFANNHAGLNNGFGTIAYYHEGGTEDREVTIANCTFAGNTAQDGTFAGAIHFRGNGSDIIKVYNSLFWDNGLSPIYRETGNAQMAYGISEYDPIGFTMTSVSNDDPKLDGEYYPIPGSPAIDAGNNDYVPFMGGFSFPALDGSNRILNSTVDLGCYEYNTAPTAIDLSNYVVEENNTPGYPIASIEIEDESGDWYDIEFGNGDGINDADNSAFDLVITSLVSSDLYIDHTADFETQSTYHILLKVEDTGGNELEQAFVITITDVNEAPYFKGVLEDRDGTVGVHMEFTIDANMVEDEDIGDILTWSTNTLPVWLDFDANTRTFSGTPDSEEQFFITVYVTDQGGLTASGTFNLSVARATAVQDLESIGGKAYPNPASDIILLDIPLNDTWVYTVADTRGAVVLEGSLPSEAPFIEVEKLMSGAYYITLFGRKHKLVVPFVRE